VSIVVGTAGHIDHGKTTLLRSLTGIDADRLPEERRRGMTIDVGYAHLALPDGDILDFVDVPGHDRLVGNMLVGAGEIDAAMLVVAADDGPRAQTLEHLELLDGLGVEVGIAVVTKIDAVPPERVAEVRARVAELLAPTTLASSPIVAASGVTGERSDQLRGALVELRDRTRSSSTFQRQHSPEGGARLAIDRVFSVKGRGTVVTGSLRGGAIERGVSLRVVPGGATVRVREIQVRNTMVDRAETGRTALNLAGEGAAGLRRGVVLTTDPAVAPTDRILVALRGAVRDRTRARLHLGTTEVGVVVGRSGRDAVDLLDGETAAILRLEQPIAIAPGDPFVLRRPSPASTLACGRVLDPDPPRGASRRRTTPERLEALARADVGEADWARARLDLHGALGRPVELATDVATAVDAAMSAMAAAQPGARVAELRRLGGRAVRRLVTLSEADASAVAADAIERLGLADRSPVEPGPELLAAMARLEAVLDVVAPPSLGAAMRMTACPPDGVSALERANRIVRLDDDLAWSFTAYRDLATKALAMAGERPLSPAAFRDATGTSRKYVVAILEDLDRRGVLRRTPDGHVAGPKAPKREAAAAGR
jgi:selenocysteine-specific elongation factor